MDDDKHLSRNDSPTTISRYVGMTGVLAPHPLELGFVRHAVAIGNARLLKNTLKTLKIYHTLLYFIIIIYILNYFVLINNIIYLGNKVPHIYIKRYALHSFPSVVFVEKILPSKHLLPCFETRTNERNIISFRSYNNSY